MNEGLIITKQILSKVSNGQHAVQWIAGQDFILLKLKAHQQNKAMDFRVSNGDVSGLIKLLQEVYGQQQELKKIKEDLKTDEQGKF